MFRDREKDGTVRLTGMSLNDILLAVHPVGSIYMSVDNVNPGTKFGGTWIAWGAGRVPVGVDTSQVEFDTVEETGGEKTHTLALDEMPTHAHAGNGSLVVTGTASGGSADNGGGSLVQGGTGGRFPHAQAFTLPANGNGNPHNNLQPYITCYMWKRTA